MPRVLVVYASRFGSTRAVAEAITETLRTQGLAADARAISQIDSLLGYDAAIIGSGVYGSALHAQAVAFIERHRAELNVMPLACFVLGARFAPGEAEAQRQCDAVVAQIARRLSPIDVRCFAGSTTGYPLVVRALTRVLHAPSSTTGDLRDWNAIRAWARGLAPRLARGA